LPKHLEIVSGEKKGTQRKSGVDKIANGKAFKKAQGAKNRNPQNYRQIYVPHLHLALSF
jgi:hypothetical protein